MRGTLFQKYISNDNALVVALTKANISTKAVDKRVFSQRLSLRLIFIIHIQMFMTFIKCMHAMYAPPLYLLANNEQQKQVNYLRSAQIRSVYIYYNAYYYNKHDIGIVKRSFCRSNQAEPKRTNKKKHRFFHTFFSSSLALLTFLFASFFFFLYESYVFSLHSVWIVCDIMQLEGWHANDRGWVWAVPGYMLFTQWTKQLIMHIKTNGNT